MILNSDDFKIGFYLQAKAGRTVDFMEFHLRLPNKSKMHAIPSKLLQVIFWDIREKGAKGATKITQLLSDSAGAR